MKESTIVGSPARSARDRDAAVSALWRGLIDHPWGQLSPSVYETARLVSLAPWLRGHDERLRFLVRTQRADGWWGRPDAYGLVPTLSAVEAALAAQARGDAVPPGLPLALARGLAALRDAVRVTIDLPDTPAIELILPTLVAAVNARLAAADGSPPLVAGATVPTAGRGPLPTKVLHSLEALGATPATLRTLDPTPPGSVGASPAATAAWLAATGPPRRDDAVAYLEALVDQHGGPVPSVAPVGTFETAWVVSWLQEAGIGVPGHFAAVLASALGGLGTAGGPGLPPDADTTSVVLAVLGRLGREPDLDCLLTYDGGDHFHTWAGERTPSVTTNAHVLDALGGRLVRRPSLAARYGGARRRVVAWLCGQQRRDGSWTDKWHASPFYATASCTLALSRFGGTPARPAVARAVRWLVGTQAADGSWGRWTPTAEETAYALHALAGRRHAVHDRGVAQAVAHGRAWLRAWSDGDGEPALWHDKDLYRPVVVVRAAVLSALRVTRRTAVRIDPPRPRPLSTVECSP